MSGPPNPSGPKPSTSVTPATGTAVQPQSVQDSLAQFVAVQAKANEIRSKEVEVQQYNAETERKKADQAHEYSLRALDAQAEDRKDERKTQGVGARYGFWISLAVVVGFLGITGYALYAGKEQVIVEVIKLLAVGGGGGGIGYALGIRKGQQSSASTPPQP